MRLFLSVVIVAFCAMIEANAAPSPPVSNQPLSDAEMQRSQLIGLSYAEGDLEMVQQCLQGCSIQSDATDEPPKSHETPRPLIGFEALAPSTYRDIVTEDKLEYQFLPATSNQIQFRIKAPNDAHIALTTGPEESNPMYEIFIGGWSNRKSVIRKNRTKPDVLEAETPGILSGDEFRGFWIRWNGGRITVGREYESNPFLEYQDTEHVEIGHFGISTGWGASGNWQILEQEISREKLCWRNATGGIVPIGAVAGGNDGETLYIGRAWHESALTPGKVHPSHGVCYLPWGGKEHAKDEYQVLCECNPKWVPSSGGEVPPNAVVGGKSQDDELLYIGRVNHEGALTVGKVHPHYGALFISYGGNEIPYYKDYEVLVRE